jgi:hypothetical protein
MSKLLISQYQREVEEIIRYGGSRNESSIRGAFQRLLGDYFDILPDLKVRGFWGQTAIAGIARLTSSNPTVDAPTA